MRSAFLVSYIFLSATALACTDEYAPVCAYWMHSPRTQTYPNRCKMLAAGAKLRHEGSCQDTPVKSPASSATSGAKQNK
jgi:hypothetical protein